MDYTVLSEIQLDALREIGNIGIGNAATAMSQLLNKKIDITFPVVNLIQYEDIFEKSNAEEFVYAVIIRVLGDAPGNMLFIIEKQSLANIVNTLCSGCDIDEMGISILAELGNIIFTTYMNAIGKMTNLLLVPSVPAVTSDMLGAILSTSFMESGQYGDYILDIETQFVQENEKLNGHFYYIPMPGSLEKILKSLGLMEGN
ncbi:MAG: chemotaxis protein CheC [Clostridium argentinense]|uniref:Chemotaxis protein CheC n=1 Tax=Clostridium faecium TaxID=2762223 RepID=A0ABR8YPL9_9CLOT|nr:MULTISPECIES: chemotaxis protein CheC [Clostridium]MBD8045971.1 chemotaxis protein CheC [Clostridium faecium]MBS5823926.1 chemotaxis protein CheC [Clostridium argentinense]MDU1349521.1 chemotaxis protein CheC [Clostridium argentinense]